MDSHADNPLILTKLRPPAARTRQIARAHRLIQWGEESATGLVLVCAPAGYGKTTLLAEWCADLQGRGQGAAWLALDPADNHPAVFGAYLLAALEEALGPSPALSAAAQRLRGSAEPDLNQVLPAIINAVTAAPRDCWLILDDYHLITAPPIHTALAYLLERRPPNLRLALGTRSDPPLPLALLRSRGQLYEVRAARLRFSLDETTRFLNEVMRLGLPADTVALLEERTEGWAAGLQLIGLSMGSQEERADLLKILTGSQRYLVDYLMDEVLARQPAETQTFLLVTSILERMCAGLCDALLAVTGGPAGSQSILERLEQGNLFLLPLDTQATWFRYHHLFRDFLRTRLEKTWPEQIPFLHQAACRWYTAQGYLREAGQHAFQVGDWSFAADFVEQNSFTLIVHSDIVTLSEWCNAFPEEILNQRPLLGILQCWSWVFRFERRNREKVETRLSQVEKTLAGLDDPVRVAELNEHAEIVRSFLSMAPDPDIDPYPFITRAQVNLNRYPDGNPGQFSGLLSVGYAHLALQNTTQAHQFLAHARRSALQGNLFYGIVESTFHLARLEHTRGDLAGAADLCRDAQAQIAARLAHPAGQIAAAGSLEIVLGCLAFEQDRLVEAEQDLVHGLQQVGWQMNPFYPMTACFALFRLYEVQGQLAQALDSLARLEAAWPEVAFCTRGMALAHHLTYSPASQETLIAAREWLGSLTPPQGPGARLPGLGLLGAADAFYQAYRAWALVQIALGDPRAGQPYLEQQLGLAQDNGLSARIIDLRLLLALTAQAQGDPAQALVHLRHALDAAQAGGFLRSFDLGPAGRTLLAAAARQADFHPYLENVLAALGAAAGQAPGQPTPPPAPALLPGGERLSPRELEILRWMAQGATNRDIAGQLYLTVGTVKSHINHILGKLGAQNRTEAVARARDLGLFEI